MLPVAAVLMLAAGVLLAGLAGYVWRQRGSAAGLSLAVLLLGVAWWGFAYALELSTTDQQARSLWGDLKYLGVGVLGPAWLAFVLQYTGRGHLVTRRLLLVLAVEPLAVQAVLANPGTHDLVRSYPPAGAGRLPVVGTGPLFWLHFAYSNVLLLAATGLFVVSMLQLSRVYWRLSATLVGAALLPWAANMLHNFAVGPFARLDLTPFAFMVTGAVLVWGLFRERLLDLAPVARGVIVETMADAVLVLDAYRRVVDANPAAAWVFGRKPADLVGRPLAELLPRHPAVAPRHAHLASDAAQLELTLPVDGRVRYFDARRQPLPDRRGRPAGELVVLRDVTERKVAETQLRHLLAERSRIAAALQASLLPAALPTVPGAAVAGRYRPAGDGREIGGDFYDVFQVGEAGWVLVLGDVSGKGAEAAAVTALVRYTLRTLAVERHRPSELLSALNESLLQQSTDERYVTVACAVARPDSYGWQVTLCLGGHHPPLLRRADGVIGPVGVPGTALGLIPDPELVDTDVRLRPGELLCLFTDGVVEARRGREQFGEPGAAAVLARHRGGPALVAEALEQAARDFHGGPLADDLAALAFEAC